MSTGRPLCPNSCPAASAFLHPTAFRVHNVLLVRKSIMKCSIFEFWKFTNRMCVSVDWFLIGIFYGFVWHFFFLSEVVG